MRIPFGRLFSAPRERGLAPPLRRLARQPRLLSLFVAVALVAPASEAESSVNGSCLTCHNRIAFDPELYALSVHGDLACADCHREFAGDQHGRVDVDLPEQEWLQAVLEAERHTDTATWSACNDCHFDVLEEMARSHHIRPMVDGGLADGPFCQDCHGPPHYLTPSPQVPAERLAFVNQTCVPCHSDPVLVEQYELNPDVVFTYETSLHGRAARLGSSRAPSCVDCHEAHAVLAGHGEGAEFSLEQRIEMCAQCHTGANANFASVVAHQRITREDTPLEWWVTLFFVTLTGGTITLLVLHILLDLLASFRVTLRRRETRGGADAD